MQTLYIDIETYSDADLQSYGVRKYVDSDNFRILLFAYAFNEEPADVIDFTQTGTKLPQRVAEALVDPKVIKTAFNATFEITCLAKAFPGLIKPEQWECDKILAHYHSIGASLATVGKALGLPEDKQKDARGKRLITYFCKPCKPTKKNGGRTVNLPEHAPEDWEIFKEYNRQDVVTERAIRHELEWLRPDDAEHDLWLIDQRINDRGVAIDTDLVKAAIAINEAYSEALIERARELTGLENPNSVAQLKEWFKLNGHPITSLNKETVEEMLKDENLHPVLKEVLRIRARLGKTSIKKYIAMRDSLCKDGRAHNLFQFYGAARTGRWAGRNIQLQNLPRNYIADLETAREAVKSGDIEWVKLMYDNVPDTLSQLIRTAIVPAPGNKFVVADFSAIEARVLAWLADETWVLDAFRAGKDIYCETASQMFGVPVEKHGQNSELRQKGKVATLACGYAGGVGALKAMGGDKMGLSDDEMQHIVDNWRKASPNIVTFWARLERAARIAVQRHRSTTLPHGIKFMWNKGHMIVQLPSKRVLVYLNVRMGENRFGNPSIVYNGVDMTKKAAGAALAELETYSGKLAENITQAVARDCLAIAMKKVEAAGYPIVAHIHDELVLEVPDTPTYNLATAIDLMTQNVGWNKGLPLNAAGFESYFYMKD